MGWVRYTQKERTDVFIALLPVINPASFVIDEDVSTTKLCRIAMRNKITAAEYVNWIKQGFWELDSRPVLDTVRAYRRLADDAWVFPAAGWSPEQAAEQVQLHGSETAFETAKVMAVLNPPTPNRDRTGRFVPGFYLP